MSDTDDPWTWAREILAAGHVPGPPAPPYDDAVFCPLALDICGARAAISHAGLAVYPDIDDGWWCLVEQFVLIDGTWEHAGGEYDNTTSPTPFERPTDAEAGDWIAWPTNGSSWGSADEGHEHHSYFGIAPVGTVRLTVTTLDGETRDAWITPWNGAYVVAALGSHSTLTGYDAEGNILGSLSSEAGPPEPEHELEEGEYRLFPPPNLDGPPGGEPILTFTPRPGWNGELPPELAGWTFEPPLDGD